MPFSLPFFGVLGFPTKIDCRKKGTLIRTSLLEDLVHLGYLLDLHPNDSIGAMSETTSRTIAQVHYGP